MSTIGTSDNPLRVAIFGAGPTGFYAVDHLFKQKDLVIKVDLYDRLPTPFGLVRGGVAPDHQKIKSVTKAYTRTAKNPNFRFFGNVEFGTDITLNDIKKHYHTVLFTTGAQTDKPLNIPGIDLENSHAATEFVAWYNGHPDYRNLKFDLTQERVAVIGVGNVAMDVARILSRSIAELEETDIADYALDALRNSQVKEVYVLGRRGPAQAAFTNPEIKEMGHLADADVFTLPEEVELDKLSVAELERTNDRTIQKKVGILQDYAKNEPTGKSRKLIFRFLVSPTELSGENGKVTNMTLVKNELYQTDSGTLRPRSTEKTEELPVGLVFRSIGYRGVPLPDVPFYDSWGVILNEKGRILDKGSKTPLTGMYTAGWIKRGPSGVIGTNKPDAVETVNLMLEDLKAEKTWSPDAPTVEAAEAMVAAKQPRYVTWTDWLKLDEMEVARGKELGRPRLKFTEVEEMLKAVGK